MARAGKGANRVLQVGGLLYHRPQQLGSGRRGQTGTWWEPVRWPNQAPSIIQANGRTRVLSSKVEWFPTAQKALAHYYQEALDPKERILAESLDRDLRYLMDTRQSQASKVKVATTLSSLALLRYRIGGRREARKLLRVK